MIASSLFGPRHALKFEVPPGRIEVDPFLEQSA